MQRPSPDFEELLGHSEWLRRLVAPLLASADGGDDALQETWLAALERPPAPPWHWRAWLARVARNRARLAVRAERRRKEREAAVARTEVAASPEEIAARVEIETKLAMLVLALEPNHRHVLLLRYYDDLPPREIATRLGVPVATVKSWLHRGLEKLRSALERERGAEWRGALAPLATASTAVVSAVPPIASALLVWGTLVKLKVSVGLCVLAGLGIWLLRLEQHANDADGSGAYGKLAEVRDAGADARIAKEPPNGVVQRAAVPPDAAPSGLPAPAEERDFLAQVVDHRGRVRDDADVFVYSKVWVAGSMVHSGGHAPYRAKREGDAVLVRIPRVKIAEALAQDRRFLAEAKESMARELSLACAIVGADYVSHPLTSEEPPETPIRLVLPPTGSVRVEVVGADGAPHEKLCIVQISASRARTETGESAAQLDFGRRGSRSIQDGHAIFSFVALGRALRIEVIDPTGFIAAQTIFAEGPVEADAEVLVRVPFHVTSPVLTGALVDGGGSILANRRIRFRAIRGGSSFGQWIQTNAQGRFELAWNHNLRNDEPWGHFELGLLEEGRDADAQVLATVPAVAMPETGTVDLGTLVLRAPERGPLLAQGIVVDGAGNPVAGVQLVFYSFWPLTREGPWEDYAQLTGDVPAHTDANGAFRLHSLVPCRGLRIDARLDGHYLERSALCAAGATDVKLVLLRGATIRGRVLLDDGIEPHEIYVRFADEQRVQAEQPLRAGATFELAGLRPTRGVLSVGLQSWPSIRIEDVVVEGTGDACDSRCAEIDLRGKLRRWPLRVLAPTDSDDLGASCFVGDLAHPNGALFVRLDHEGRAAPWFPIESEELFVYAESHAPQRVTYRSDEQLVQFEAPRKVTLELPPEGAPPSGYALSVALSVPPKSTLSTFERRAVSGRKLKVEAGARIRIAIPVPGSYQLRWFLRSTSADREVELDERTLEVPAEPRESKVVTGPTRDEIASAIEKLR